MCETKCPLFLWQVSGRSLCLSQSCTLFGGPGSPWVETSWCWLVEGLTLCLLCTSTEEEPGNCWGPCNVTSSWTSKCHRPNSSSCSCHVVIVSMLEFTSWHETADVQFQTELLLTFFVDPSHDWGKKKSHDSCCYHQVTGWRASLPCLPSWLRRSVSVLR